MLLTLLSFAAATFLLAIVPGPTTALVLRQTLRYGRRIAFTTTLGNSTGILAWALAATLGLSGLLTAAPAAFTALRYAGAAVLIGMGVRTLLGAGGVDHDEGLNVQESRPDAKAISAWSAFQTGFWTNLTNPKAAVFTLSFLPQFIPSGAPTLRATTPLALIWFITDTLWFVLLAFLINSAKRLLSQRKVRRRLEQATGAMLVGFGARITLERS